MAQIILTGVLGVLDALRCPERQCKALSAASALLAVLSLSGCAGQRLMRSSRPQPPILFVRNVNEIMLLYEDGSTRYVTEGEQPKWSRDHRELVFERANFLLRPTPGSEAWRIRPDGTGLRQLTSIYPEQVRFLAFGGARPTVAYADARGIDLVSLDGSHTREAIHDGASADELAFSPDGRQIAYADSTLSSPSTLDVVGVHGLGQRVIFKGTVHTCAMRWPSWSPDGRWIAFTMCVEKGMPKVEVGVWLIHPDGRDLHRVALGSEPSWSPDGEWIAFNRTPSASAEGEAQGLFKVHPDGSGLVRLTRATKSLGFPDASPEDSQPNW